MSIPQPPASPRESDAAGQPAAQTQQASTPTHEAELHEAEQASTQAEQAQQPVQSVQSVQPMPTVPPMEPVHPVHLTVPQLSVPLTPAQEHERRVEELHAAHMRAAQEAQAREAAQAQAQQSTQPMQPMQPAQYSQQPMQPAQPFAPYAPQSFEAPAGVPNAPTNAPLQQPYSQPVQQQPYAPQSFAQQPQQPQQPQYQAQQPYQQPMPVAPAPTQAPVTQQQPSFQSQSQPAAGMPLTQEGVWEANYLNARHKFSHVGACVCLLLGAWVLLSVAIAGALAHVTFTSAAMASLFESSLPLYLIAMPIAVYAMSSIKPVAVRSTRMKASRFWLFALFCLPVMYIGNIIGNLLAAVLSSGTATNSLDSMLQVNTPMDVFWNIVLAVLFAPIAEEWFFRKQLISRLRVYGEKLAIVFSAFAFALFHMNLYQFFYAFGLGLLFGYVYTRTSNMIYSTLLHMLVNLVGGVIAPMLLAWAGNGLDAALSADSSSALYSNGLPVAVLSTYALATFVLSIIGLIVMIRRRHTLFYFYEAPLEIPAKMRVQIALGNPGVIVFVVITLLLTFASLL